ncbi:MAG: MATE family efflux transporter, partial [Clostridiales bacterium]|nr:MATE family efflux transporter [Clostridiales bacterium]
MFRKFIGDKKFYFMVMTITLPIIVQNAITNFVSLLDNIMVGQVGTEQMSGVAIVNQLMFVYSLCIFGAVSGAGIFGAQFFGSGDHEGFRNAFRFKLISCILVFLLGTGVLISLGTP